MYISAPFSNSFLMETRFGMGHGCQKQHDRYFKAPAIQLFDEKMRLVKLLWIPYSNLYHEKLVAAQAECYLCYSEPSEVRYILLPLRLPSDYTPKIKPAFEAKIREVEKDIRTFVFDYEIWHRIVSMLDSPGNIFCLPFVFLHDTQGTQYYSIQFFQPTEIERTCSNCNARFTEIYSPVNKDPILNVKCWCK